MSDLRTTLERGVGGATPPPDGLERMLRRGDRKRRNQRITAGLVGFAVFLGAIWFVATGGPFDRAQTPGGGGVATGPTVTEPTVTQPTLPDGAAEAGLMGFPDEGATPSTPASGDLVFSVMFGYGEGDARRFSAFLYTDGRLIWSRLSDPVTGIVEQRLTPEGVELLRAAVLSTGLFDRDRHLTGGHGLRFGQIQVHTGDQVVRVLWGDCCDPESSREETEMPTPEQAEALLQLDVRIEDPGSWLPASAWEDQEMRPYVPTRYSVCYDTDLGIELDRVLASLPRKAEDLLRSWDRTFERLPVPLGNGNGLDIWCSDVTTEQARALASILEDAGVGSRDLGSERIFVTRLQGDPGAPEITIGFWTQLPHQVP